jgi:AAA domain, putative AbiEii toxin, Type IV TA system
MTDFTVVAPSRYDPSGYVGAALMQDNWNDYGFETQYHLHVATPEFTGRIGAVKILKRGQISADRIQIGVGPLAPLSEDWISLGQSLDYYERLAELPAPLRQDILLHLRDALAYPEHVDSFLGEEGWRVSILRDLSWDSFRQDAAVLLDRDYTRVARMGLQLEFQMAGWSDPLIVDFQAPSVFAPLENDGLPDRIAVIVGRNGSGKSTLLSRLARILHASQRDRATDALQALGAIIPAGIGFTRVVNIAYSAFDAFQLPGLGFSERTQIVADMERGSGRYYYCGLRDLAHEVRREQGIGDIDGRPIAAVGLDRQEETILRSIDELTREFGAIIERMRQQGREELFTEVCRVLASDPSFADLGAEPAASVFRQPIEWFRSWSTGHKIVMHALGSLVAYTEPKSIVLFDEPETHLHPPLLAALMHAVRLVLRRNDAFAIIATHSPVVVQETLSRHIAVVRRSGAETNILSTRIETYGESIGEITNEVFGLNADATDFHLTLSRFVARGYSLETIENLFEKGLSLQARAFVMTELGRRST